MPRAYKIRKYKRPGANSLPNPDPKGVKKEIRGKAIVAAARAMSRYKIDSQQPLNEKFVANFLANLMHWCDVMGINFEESLSVARLDYKHEL